MVTQRRRVVTERRRPLEGEDASGWSIWEFHRAGHAYVTGRIARLPEGGAFVLPGVVVYGLAAVEAATPEVLAANRQEAVLTARLGTWRLAARLGARASPEHLALHPLNLGAESEALGHGSR